MTYISASTNYVIGIIQGALSDNIEDYTVIDYRLLPTGTIPRIYGIDIGKALLVLIGDFNNDYRYALVEDYWRDYYAFDRGGSTSANMNTNEFRLVGANIFFQIDPAGGRAILQRALIQRSAFVSGNTLYRG